MVGTLLLILKESIILNETMPGKQGLGKAIANILASKRVRTILLDRTLPNHAEDIRLDHKCVYYYQCDVSKYEEVLDVAKRIREEV